MQPDIRLPYPEVWICTRPHVQFLQLYFLVVVLVLRICVPNYIVILILWFYYLLIELATTYLSCMHDHLCLVDPFLLLNMHLMSGIFYKILWTFIWCLDGFSLAKLCSSVCQTFLPPPNIPSTKNILMLLYVGLSISVVWTVTPQLYPWIIYSNLYCHGWSPDQV